MDTHRQTCPESTPTEEADLLECGKVTAETRGMPNLPLYELGIPPYDRIFVSEPQ
jgi:hypothetical protein